MVTGNQAKTLKNIVSSKMKSSSLRVLAVGSGKGGVGKTNIVANLAYAFTQRNKKVLVVDADLGLNNIDILLGLAPKFNIGHVLAGEKNVEEIIIKGPADIQLLPAGDGLQELTQLDGEKKVMLMEELDRVSNGYDFLIFDTGAGISTSAGIRDLRTGIATMTRPGPGIKAPKLAKKLLKKPNLKYGC